ncbi:hypothetical protein CLOM_g12708 [Closterium sp. NIES-68]|nr:hypothetical protein CLOM_g12708 [Closterium sp. NIES-68]
MIPGEVSITPNLGLFTDLNQKPGSKRPYADAFDAADDTMFSFGQPGDLFDRGVDQLMTYMGENPENDDRVLPNVDRILPDDVPEESVGEGGSHGHFGMFHSNPFGSDPVSFQDGSCQPQLVPCAPKPASQLASLPATAMNPDAADSVADGAFAGSPDAFSSPDGFASDELKLSFGAMDDHHDDVDALNQQDLRYNLMLRGAGLAEHSTADDVSTHPKMEYPALHPMSHPMYPQHMPLYYPGMPTMPPPYYGMTYPPFAYNPWMTPYALPFMPPQHAMPGAGAIADPAAIARQRRLSADSARGKRRRHAAHHAAHPCPTPSRILACTFRNAFRHVFRTRFGHPVQSASSMFPWTHIHPDAPETASPAPSSPFLPSSLTPPFSPSVIPSSPKAAASPVPCASPVVGEIGTGRPAAKESLAKSSVTKSPLAKHRGVTSPAVVAAVTADAEITPAPATTAAETLASPALKVEDDESVPATLSTAIPATIPGSIPTIPEAVPGIVAPALAAAQQARGGKRTAKQQRDERRVKRLLRNRVSAQQARERKKHYVAELEQRCEAVERSNAEIEAEIAALVAENERLRQSIRPGARER